MRYLLERLTWKISVLAVATAATAGAMAEQQSHPSPAANPFGAAMSKIVADVAAHCREVELQSYYRKTPCQSGDIAPAQLADSSKATADEKAAIQKVKSEAAEMNRRLAQAFRQYGGQKGNDMALVAEKVGQQQEQAMTDLVLEKISWGEYNSRRKDISRHAREDMTGGNHAGEAKVFARGAAPTTAPSN